RRLDRGWHAAILRVLAADLVVGNDIIGNAVERDHRHRQLGLAAADVEASNGTDRGNLVRMHGGERIAHEAAATVAGHEHAIFVEQQFADNRVDQLRQELGVGGRLARKRSLPTGWTPQCGWEHRHKTFLVRELLPTVVAARSLLAVAGAAMQHDHQWRRLLLTLLEAAWNVQQVLAPGG